MNQDAIGTTICGFIRSNFIFDDKKLLGEDESLLGSGVVDSTGILELIAFLEETYHLKFMDQELVADNFDSVNKIKAFVLQKLSQAKN